MKSIALTVCLCIVASTAFAQPTDASMERATRGRGWLTAAGMTAIALSAVGVSLGVAGELSAADSKKWLLAYTQNGRVPEASEATMIRALVSRSNDATTLARVGFGGAGVALALGISAMLVDGWWSAQPVAIAVVPTSTGGVLSVGGTF